LIGIFFTAVACLTPLAKQATAPKPPMTVAWQTEIALEGQRHLAVGTRAVIVAGSESGISAHAIDDGHLLWHGSTSTNAQPVTIGRLVVVAVEGSLQALDQQTGQEAWQITVGATEASPPLSLSATDNLLFASQGTSVTALRPDGSIAWQRALPSPLVTQIVRSGDVLLAGLQEPEMAAIDPGTGATRWSVRLPAAATALAAVADQVFVPTAKGELFAYRVAAGGPKRMWRHRNRAVPAVGAPVVSEKRVFYALIDNTLKAFDRNGGTKVWTTPLESRAVTGPILVGGHVIVPLSSGALAQVPAADGKLPEKPSAAPVTTGRMGAHAVSNGSVYAIMTASNATTTLVAWRSEK